MEGIKPEALHGPFHPTRSTGGFLHLKPGTCATEISLKHLLASADGQSGLFTSSSFQKLTVAADVSVVPLVTGKAAVKLMIVQIKSASN